MTAGSLTGDTIILNDIDAESCPSLAIISTVPKSYKFSINSIIRTSEAILNWTEDKSSSAE